MKKAQQTNTPAPQTLTNIHCNLCGKKSQFMCGRCHDIGYCKPQHQKADWPAHRVKCISLQQKTIIHNRQKYQTRSQIMNMLAHNQYIEASQLASQLMQKQLHFFQSNPSIENQIQYGATAMLLTRIWIYYKDFNKALDVLNTYLHSQTPFLTNIQNLNLPQDTGQIEPQKKKIISSKLNLISAVASVSHELVRNAMNIYQILIKHIQAIYGPYSTQLASIYFYAGNYLNFLNQPNKAFACFLKCAKLKNQNCSSSYYNAGIICLTQKNYNQALDTLLLALNNLNQNQRSKHQDIEVNILQALGSTYRNLNNYTKTVVSIEKALCLRQKSKDLSSQHKRKYFNLLNLLATIKSETQKTDSQIKMYNLPKEKPNTIRLIQLNKEQYKNIMQADNPARNTEQQNQDWIESFNENRKRLNIVSKIPQVPPIAYQKLLRKNKQQVVRQEQVPSLNKTKDKKSYEQKLNINLQFIQALNASEMDFLNQLNRLLSECKQKSALIDIFQNSNLFQTINKQKLDHFYRLNPKFLRVQDKSSRNNVKIEENEQIQDNQNYQKENTNIQTIQKKNKVVTPRLNLQNLKKK